jgi:nucleotide-binding universal stress UspA family protein
MAIIRFYREKSVDLVVMITCGKSGLKRAFLGSLADEAIREPSIPALAIRPRRQRTKKKK